MNPLKFIPVAEAMAGLSKDPRTKVGAIVIDDDGNILSTGWNSFPRGVDDDPVRYADREVKNRLVSHAESNCVSQAARNGVRLKGSSIIVTELFPCSNCAKLIIQAGIRRVYAPVMKSHHSDQWFEEKAISDLMFGEAGVEVVEYAQ
jgi:dCMP deaminase